MWDVQRQFCTVYGADTTADWPVGKGLESSFRMRVFLGGAHRVAEVKVKNRDLPGAGGGACSFVKFLYDVLVGDASKNGIESRIWGHINSKSRIKFEFEAYVLNS